LAYSSSNKDLDLVCEINIYKKRAKGGEIGSEKEEWRVGNNVEIREATTEDPTNESIELHYHFFLLRTSPLWNNHQTTMSSHFQ
jgi:hypothetical protein